MSTVKLWGVLMKWTMKIPLALWRVWEDYREDLIPAVKKGIDIWRVLKPKDLTGSEKRKIWFGEFIRWVDERDIPKVDWFVTIIHSICAGLDLCGYIDEDFA